MAWQDTESTTYPKKEQKKHKFAKLEMSGHEAGPRQLTGSFNQLKKRMEEANLK